MEPPLEALPRCRCAVFDTLGSSTSAPAEAAGVRLRARSPPVRPRLTPRRRAECSSKSRDSSKSPPLTSAIVERRGQYQAAPRCPVASPSRVPSSSGARPGRPRARESAPRPRRGASTRLRCGARAEGTRRKPTAQRAPCVPISAPTPPCWPAAAASPQAAAPRKPLPPHAAVRVPQPGPAPVRRPPRRPGAPAAPPHPQPRQAAASPAPAPSRHRGAARLERGG